MKKAIFIDRDGVINVDSGYVHSINEFVPIIDNINYIKELNTTDEYLNFIITNQAGIAHGYYTESIFQTFQKWVENYLSGCGLKIEKTYYCPHHVDGIIKKYKKQCFCRKPDSGMLLKAAEEYNLDLKNCIMIGDKESDLIAGRSVGCKVFKI